MLTETIAYRNLALQQAAHIDRGRARLWRSQATQKTVSGQIPFGPPTPTLAMVERVLRVSGWPSLAVSRRRNRRQRPTAHLNGPLRTTANGFEDRVSDVRQRLPKSAQDGNLQPAIR